MSLQEREAKRKSSIVGAIISEEPQKSLQNETDKDDQLKQRSYYLTADLIKAITIKTAQSDLDKSAVVREALKLYLADILENL